MTVKIRTHLMFEGSAEEAMNLYVSLFPDSKVVETRRYSEGSHKGKLQIGSFSLAGREFLCIDSPVKHDFNFTPAMSIFVDFDDERALEKVFAELSIDGEALMPLGHYGFSRRFGWLTDRFGVSWQLNLP